MSDDVAGQNVVLRESIRDQQRIAIHVFDGDFECSLHRMEESREVLVSDAELIHLSDSLPDSASS